MINIDRVLANTDYPATLSVLEYYSCIPLAHRVANWRTSSSRIAVAGAAKDCGYRIDAIKNHTTRSEETRQTKYLFKDMQNMRSAGDGYRSDCVSQASGVNQTTRMKNHVNDEIALYNCGLWMNGMASA